MTETKYLKIISDLFRLTGYTRGLMDGIARQIDPDPETLKETLFQAVEYTEEQQDLILKQLEEDE